MLFERLRRPRANFVRFEACFLVGRSDGPSAGWPTDAAAESVANFFVGVVRTLTVVSWHCSRRRKTAGGVAVARQLHGSGVAVAWLRHGNGMAMAPAP